MPLLRGGFNQHLLILHLLDYENGKREKLPSVTYTTQINKIVPSQSIV